MQQRHNQKKGFNLIETAVVLALVGAVIGAIWVGAATMIENYNVNKTVEGITTNVSNIRKFLGRLGVNPNCSSTCALDFQWQNYKDTGVFKGMLGFYESYADDGVGNMYPVLKAPIGTGYVVSAYSGAYPIPGGEIVNDYITLSVFGLSKSACIKIGKKLWSSTNKNFGVFRIVYNGSNYFWNSPLPSITCTSGNGNWIAASYKLII